MLSLSLSLHRLHSVLQRHQWHMSLKCTFCEIFTILTTKTHTPPMNYAPRESFSKKQCSPNETVSFAWTPSLSSSATSTPMLSFSQNKQLILLHFKSGNGNGHTTYFMDAFNSAALIFYFICSNSRRRRQRFSLNSLLWPRSRTRAAVIIFVHFSSNYHTYCFQHMLRMGY